MHRTPLALVVDDDPAVAGVLRAFLLQGGYRVLTAGTAAEALQLASPEVDVAVVDIGLPDMGGGVLAAMLGEACDGVGVVMVTGYSAEDVVRYGVDASNVRVLSKPFPPEMLLVACREVQRGERDAPALRERVRLAVQRDGATRTAAAVGVAQTTLRNYLGGLEVRSDALERIRSWAGRSAGG